MSDKVQCDKCKGIFRATPFNTKLVCKECFEERPPDATGKELIGEFLSDYEEVRDGLEGVEIPYNVILKMISLKEKWEERRK